MKILSSRRSSSAAGFTLIEMLVVLGIMGIVMVVSYPSIMNTQAVRDLDNATRQVQTFLQMTKHQAVSSKLVHRVRFYQPFGAAWSYDMERREADGSWVRAQPNVPPKTIPPGFNVTISFRVVGADREASFSPMGTFPGEAVFTAFGTFPSFDPTQNSIALQSPKLQRLDQMDERVLSVFMGGTIAYAKRKSA